MKHEPKPDSDLILYQTEDGRTRLQVRLQGDTVWLTQAQMAELFQRERSVITKHIRNLFEEGELVERAVCANRAHTAADGKTYQTIQNKLHFAATGKTAAELIAERADSSQPNMGLTAWHGGVVRKGDVTVAKNYLREDEIEITLVSVNKRENFLPDFTRGRINLKGGSPTLTVGMRSGTDRSLRPVNRRRIAKITSRCSFSTVCKRRFGPNCVWASCVGVCVRRMQAGVPALKN